MLEDDDLDVDDVDLPLHVEVDLLIAETLAEPKRKKEFWRQTDFLPISLVGEVEKLKPRTVEDLPHRPTWYAKCLSNKKEPKEKRPTVISTADLYGRIAESAGCYVRSCLREASFSRPIPRPVSSDFRPATDSDCEKSVNSDTIGRISTLIYIVEPSLASWGTIVSIVGNHRQYRGY